jgi:hypothetical protein
VEERMAGPGSAATARRGGVDGSSGLAAVARLGLVAQGVMYLIIGALALQLALGGPSESPDQEGAIEWISGQPLGRALLVALTLGLAAMAAWRAIEAVRGDPVEGEEAADRVGYAIKAVVYGSFAVTAAVAAAKGGGSSGGGNGAQQGTALILDWPGGRFLVVAIGLGLAAYGVYTAWRHTVKKEFHDWLDPARVPDPANSPVTRIGQVAYAARAVVFVVTGALLVRMAVDYDPAQPVGLSAALLEVSQATWGPLLLGLLAVGLALYGVLSLVMAWARRVA